MSPVPLKTVSLPIIQMFFIKCKLLGTSVDRSARAFVLSTNILKQVVNLSFFHNDCVLLYLDQLLGARSNQKLVKIHNSCVELGSKGS